MGQMGRYLVVLCVLACGHGNSNSSGGQSAKLKSSLDLNGVIGFAIAGSAAAHADLVGAAAADAGTCMPSNLYAVGSDGTMTITSVTEVSGMGSDGHDAPVMCETNMQTENATALFDTPSYVVLDYSPVLRTDCSTTACTFCGFVVLRKSDGALFCADQDPQPGGNPPPPVLGMPQQVQGDGDILTLESNLSGGITLERLDMSASPPTLTIVDDTAQTGDHISTYNVDTANDALVAFMSAGTFGERVYLANGGLVNVSTVMELIQWIGGDGDFYYSYMGSSSEIVSHLSQGTYAATTDASFPGGGGGGFALATSTHCPPSFPKQCTQAYAWESATAMGGGGPNAIMDLLPSAAGGICFGSGAPLACSTDSDCAGTCACSPGGCQCSGGGNNGGGCGSGSGSAADCAPTCSFGGAQHVVSGVDISGINNGLGFGSDIYLQATDSVGNGEILDVNVSSLDETACCTTAGCCPTGGCCSSPVTPTTLLAAGAYSLTAISLSATGELTFAGLRNSDGARVVGNCVAGTCTVLNATAPDVSVLTRIN
jgi:hypothetical protein